MESTPIQILIDQAHEQLEYRPVVAMMIFESMGGVLAVQSAKNSDWWGFPQGGIDPGESLEDAAFREAFEELGLTRRDLEFEYLHEWLDIDADVTRVDKRGFTRGKRIFFVSMKCRAGTQLALDPNEVASAIWVLPADFPAVVVSTREEKRVHMVAALERCLTAR